MSHTPFVKSYRIVGRYPERIGIRESKVYFCAFCGVRLFKDDDNPWYRCECPKAQEFLRKQGLK